MNIVLIFISLICLNSINLFSKINYSTTLPITVFNNVNQSNPSYSLNYNSNLILLETTPSAFGIDKLNYNKLFSSVVVKENLMLNFGLEGIFNDLFNNYSTKLGLSSLINERLSLGFQLEYNHYVVKNFNSSSLLNLDIGGIYDFDNFLYLAFVIKNLLGNSYTDFDNYKEQLFQLGVGLQLLEEIAIGFDIALNLYNNTSYIFSLKYEILQSLHFNISYCNLPLSFNYGFNIKILKDLFFQISSTKYQFSNFHFNISLLFIW